MKKNKTVIAGVGRWRVYFSIILIISLSSCKTGEIQSITRNSLLEKKQSLKEYDYEYYQTLYRLGDMKNLQKLLSVKSLPSPDLKLLSARVSIYLGNYKEAEKLLNILKKDGQYRTDAETLLGVIYYHQNQYKNSVELFKGVNDESLPEMIREMRFLQDNQPYMVNWNGKATEEVPFLSDDIEQTLPYVRISVNGNPLDCYVDTGGSLLHIPRSLAKKMGVIYGFETEGIYAGGKESRSFFGYVKSIKIGEIELKNVPVIVGSESMGCFGTGLMRQFITTIDYPAGKMILYPKTASPSEIIENKNPVSISFGYMGTHYLFGDVKINGCDTMHFLIDSGLESSDAGAIPDTTYEFLKLKKAARLPVFGEGGSGASLYFVGVVPVESISMGKVEKRETSVLTGVFPEQLCYVDDIQLGFIVDGLISHGFLLHHAVTIDFEKRKIYFQ